MISFFLKIPQYPSKHLLKLFKMLESIKKTQLYPNYEGKLERELLFFKKRIL
jgi:hypothetical protein